MFSNELFWHINRNFLNFRGRLKKRGPLDKAYNPNKLQEINIRRPYPFLCGVLTNGHRSETGSGLASFSMFPKEVQTHIKSVVNHLPNGEKVDVNKVSEAVQSDMVPTKVLENIKESNNAMTPSPNSYDSSTLLTNEHYTRNEHTLLYSKYEVDGYGDSKQLSEILGDQQFMPAYLGDQQFMPAYRPDITYESAYQQMLYTTTSTDMNTTETQKYQDLYNYNQCFYGGGQSNPSWNNCDNNKCSPYALDWYKVYSVLQTSKEEMVNSLCSFPVTGDYNYPAFEAYSCSATY
jgi:hypothetical protein